MKKYLVAYNVGVFTKSTIIEVPNDYIPASDNMKTIKEMVMQKDKLHYIKACAAPDHCGGYFSTVETNYEISEDDLVIIAISNLEI